jgi:hypothetical protein
MSTRAQIAIQTGPEEWTHIYCHFDGYPAHMLPALVSWTPDDILAAGEIRQAQTDRIDCFNSPRAPRVHPEPRRDFCHTYVFEQGRWVEWRAPPLSARSSSRVL